MIFPSQFFKVPIEKHTQVPNRQISENQIKISNLKKSDTGNYGCNASNSLGYVYKDVYVNVLSLPPEILTPPAKQSRVVQGEPVTISCKTFGAPKPLIKWFHDGQELYGDRYDLMANGNLVIKYVHCNVYNTHCIHYIIHIVGLVTLPTLCSAGSGDIG